MADPIIGKISVGDGATFTPSINNDVLSWSNNKNLPNPESLDIVGATFTPAVSSAGELSWTNNKNLPNPETVDIAQAVMDRYQIAPVNSPAFTGTPTAPTPDADDDSTKIATTGYVQAELEDYATLTDMAGYLPLSGGTMTGTLTLKSPIVVANQTVTSRRNVTDSWNLLLGGTTDSNGAYLRLDGSTSSMAGSFTLNANNGTNRKTLVGSPNGTLTWGGTSISLNGHTHSYLPLSGGTMTGEIIRNTYVVKNSVDNSYTEYMGGKDETSSYFVLYGKNHSSTPGRINLRANNGTTNSYLTLEPNGSMTWGGVSITDGTFLTTRSVSVNASSGTAGYSITAPAVSGYKFICWYMSASDGNTYPTYIANSNTSSTKVWAVNPTNNTSIVCFALYVRKW